ncbi:CgeB family protein [Nibrella viscosa]|uniref:CgeB family protein n=1 Tax=Nibrella viscosa TaxID=1084524 RepID=UPI0031E7963E
MKVYIIGNSNEYALEASYRRAFQKMGLEVIIFDPVARVRPYIPYARLGSLFHRFVPVDSWQRKMNRELALDIKENHPDLVLSFCNSPVLFSTIAFVRSIVPTRFFLVWPDPLTNLQAHVSEAASLYDGVATYCRASVPIFEQLGFRNVQWIPLAADVEIHCFDVVPSSFAYDLTFLGAWRPERERTLATIAQHFPTLRIAVRGTDWQRNRTSLLRAYIQHKPVRGRDYAAFLNSSRINLNVIDDTCFPAANMRFFEVPIASGLQLVSQCPEMEDNYQNNKHVYYYRGTDDLLGRIERIITSQADANEIRRFGLEHTLKNHTYSQRAEQLIRMVLDAPKKRSIQC